MPDNQALIETAPLPDDPGCTAYQITGPTWGDVQNAIDAIFLAPGNYEATFRNPTRIGARWLSRGFVRSFEHA